MFNNEDRLNRIITEAQCATCYVTRCTNELHVSFTHIYLPFLWVWAGRSPRSRLCRGSASCSGCSLPRWCCARTRSPASPCRTRSCWRAGCTCTWDRAITTEDRQTDGRHTLSVEFFRWREWSKAALAVEPLFCLTGLNWNPSGLSDYDHAFTKPHYVLLCKNRKKYI